MNSIVASKLRHACFIVAIICLTPPPPLALGEVCAHLGGDLWGVCALGGQGAAAMVEDPSGDVGSAGHRVAVDSAV